MAKISVRNYLSSNLSKYLIGLLLVTIFIILLVGLNKHNRFYTNPSVDFSFYYPSNYKLIEEIADDGSSGKVLVRSFNSSRIVDYQVPNNNMEIEVSWTAAYPSESLETIAEATRNQKCLPEQVVFGNLDAIKDECLEAESYGLIYKGKKFFVYKRPDKTSMEKEKDFELIKQTFNFD